LLDSAGLDGFSAALEAPVDSLVDDDDSLSWAGLLSLWFPATRGAPEGER